uniref:Uncharacterized protein n=1 Tax=Ditylenchus dipsaci TaxID=166011 RepID=A0A915EL39_9BILA
MTSLPSPLDTCKLLIRGVVEARKSCKLPFLTGGAVVSYGLPISSLLSVKQLKSSREFLSLTYLPLDSELM